MRYGKELVVNKDNLYDVVSDVLHDMTIEQLAHYATKFASRGVVTESGYELPQSAGGGVDGVFGIDTDFPVSIAMGQTWNENLMERVGNVIGTEIRGRHDFDDPNTLVFAAVSDMRGNPLCGRYYESFSEDSHITSQLAAAMCSGISGKGEFYLLGQPATKHYYGYQAEWNHYTSSNYFNKRTLMDEQLKGFYGALRSGKAIGVMTAFGGVNGIPNALAINNDKVSLPSPYHIFSISDFNNDYRLSGGLGNGFDKVYVNNAQYIAALMIKAKTTSNNIMDSMVTEQDFITAVQDGILDVTREDLEEMIRPQIELWFRTGLYGRENYPYLQLCKDYLPLNASADEHKEVALQTAEESIILLKNEENILPMPIESNIFVAGILGDKIIKPFYTVGGIKDFEHAHLTVYEALKERAGMAGKIDYNDNLALTNTYLKSQKNQKYIRADSEGNLYASEDSISTATLFQIIDWGQDVYSIRKASTDEYMQMRDNYQDVCVKKLEKAEKIPVFTYEDWNGTRAMRYGAILTSVGQQLITGVQFYEYYISMGYYLLVDEKTNQIVLDGMFRKEPLDSERFIPVEEPNVDNFIDFASYDYAVVAIGIPIYINASEKTDRPSMSIGSQEMELVNMVASKFRKRTIVVVCSEMPLDIEAIKNNPDVAAIISYPYGGQYGGWALAQTIYGDSNPSAKLTITWPNNISHLPPLKPEPWIDPRYTVNMKETEPSSNKMTYLYQTENIMYPFGYGLSYGSFVYSNVTAELTEDGITVLASIKNLARAGKEVVQIYAVKKSAFYGEYMPLKKLIAFTKTDVIAENETVSVSINIPLNRLEQWFENLGRYAIEEGEVDIIIVGTGYQSDTMTLNIPGETIPPTFIFNSKKLWDIACYTDGIRGSEVSKTETMLKHTFHCACESDKETGYAVIPRTVIAPGIITMRIASVGEGTIELHINGVDGECLGIMDVSDTGAADYQLVSRENNRIITGQESRYISKSIHIQTTPSIVDLYVVMKGIGIKIDFIWLRKEGVTTDWTAFQRDANNNGIFNVDYNLMLNQVSGTMTQISLPDGNHESMGGEVLTCKKDDENYIFAQYSDDVNGIRMRAYNVKDLETELWDKQLFKDAGAASQLSTPIVVNDAKYGDVLFALSTQYDTVFGTFSYPLTIGAATSNTLEIKDVRLVGHYHVIKIDTGLTGYEPYDFSAKVVMSSASHTYEFNADYLGGTFVIDLNGAAMGMEDKTGNVIYGGQYTFAITLENKTNRMVSANIRILIPYWELSSIHDITGKGVVTRLMTTYGEANTPMKQFHEALYFGTYDAYGAYFKFNIKEYTLSRCNPEAGDGFYWAGAAEINVGDENYLICGSELGNIYLMDESDSFTSGGGIPVKTISLGDYLEGAGAVRSSICQAGDYVYFTSQNGYLWRIETKTLMDARPQLEYLRLSGKSTSTPAAVDDYVFVGTYVEQEGRKVSGAVNIVDVSDGSFEKMIMTEDIGPICASLIVNREEDGYYIYFTTNEAAGGGYCCSFRDGIISKVWETEASFALQGMSAGDGFLVYGDGNKRLHIVR